MTGHRNKYLLKESESYTQRIIGINAESKSWRSRRVYLKSHTISRKSPQESVNIWSIVFLNGDYRITKMAKQKFLGLKNEQNLQHIIFPLKDKIKGIVNKNTQLHMKKEYPQIIKK